MPLRKRTGPSGPFATDEGSELVSVENLAALQLVEEFDLAWVESLKCLWHRDAASTMYVDGITIVAAVDGGRWERMVSTTSYDWLLTSSWRIDSATGDDEAAGGPTAPLATADELARRLSVGALYGNTTITIAAGTTLDHFEADIDLGDANLLIIGEPTVVVTDTVSAYTDRTHPAYPTTPTATRLEATSVADWNAYVGLRFRVTQGTGAGAHAWIARADPQSAGVDVARISVPGTYPFAIPLDPVPGDTFVLETLPSIGNLRLRVTGRDTTYLEERIGIRDLSMSDAVEISAGVGSTGFAIIVWACEVTTFDPDEGFSVWALTSEPTIHFKCCCFQDSAGGIISGAAWDGSLFRNATFSIAFDAYADHPLSCGNNLYDDFPLAAFGSGNTYYDSQWFDTGGTAVQVYGESIYLTDSVSGDGNVIGLVVGGVANAKGCYVGYDEVINLQGSSANIRIEGDVDLDIDPTDLPYNGNSQKGVGALVAGTATITARGANARGVLLSKADQAGAIQGTLSAPTASRAPTQFVVNSVDSGGVLVATDGSTFDWYIPEEARGIQIANMGTTAAAG